MKRCLLLLLLFGLFQIVKSQCPDFTDLNGTGVTCQYGSFTNPFQYTGVMDGRHTVLTQQGSDPNANNLLPFLPPGESAVVRLGDRYAGAQAEAITYRFTVDPDRAILLLKFAVVFEDPGHAAPDQPRFVVRVLNGDGFLVDECAEYDVTASGNIPGFQNGSAQVVWRPWTNMGIDLSPYAGQIVQVQFVNYDCGFGAHLGYAYFTATCINSRLELAGCDGDQITLSAPEGFESYQWDNGSTSTTATYTIDGTTSANCLITSFTGCQFTLSGTISTDPGIPSSDVTLYDTICEGDSYSGHFFNLPAQYEPGIHYFRNTFFNISNCSGGDVTTTLVLTVLPRYYHIYDAVCQGTAYNAHGFHYTNLQTGIYTDTLETAMNVGCGQILVLHLTVHPSFNLPNAISGPTTVCRNEVSTYSLPNAEGLAFFQWDVPIGVGILIGENASEVSLYFSDIAPNPATISLTGANGCGSGNLSLDVTILPTYHLFFQDTICQGNEYHRYGFDLPQQDSVGWFTFINNGSTAQGCDSVSALQLQVAATPTLSTLAQPDEICIGDSATVHAFGENGGLMISTQGPPIAIGDILCSDNSIVKPSDWPMPGKTATGIVFYVDNLYEHGWAVHLYDLAWDTRAMSDMSDIPSIANYTTASTAIMDLDGYTNTQQIRAAGDNSIYEAAYAVDFANGWHLPSAGQLRLIYAEIVTLNASLLAASGTPFPMDDSWLYWSSTEDSGSAAWIVNNVGTLIPVRKNSHNFLRVRSIREF